MIFYIFPLILIGISLYLVSRNIRWGLVLLVVTLPLNNRLMFDLFYSPQLLPIRVVTFALVISSIWLGLRWLRKEGPRKVVDTVKKTLSQDPFLFLLLALWLVRILSLNQPINIFSSATFLFFYSTMVFLYALMRYVFQKNDRSLVYKIFELHAWVAFATAVYSLVQLLAYENWARVLPGVWPSLDEPTRFGSTFWDINHYAPYIGSVIPYFLLKTIYEPNLRRRWLYLFGFIVTNLGMGMTLSRSGWLGYAFSLLVLGLVLLWRKLGKACLWYFLTMVTMLSLVIIGVIYFNSIICIL